MIRAATEADLDHLTALEHACFGPGAWTRAALASELSRSFVLMDGAGRGYAIGLPVLDECELLRIGVTPIARGAGLGALLLGAFHDACRQRQIVRVMLEVREDNVAARGLYAAGGYAEEGRRRGYYADHSGSGASIDALLLGRQL